MGCREPISEGPGSGGTSFRTQLSWAQNIFLNSPCSIFLCVFISPPPPPRRQSLSVFVSLWIFSSLLLPEPLCEATSQPLTLFRPSSFTPSPCPCP